MIFEKFINIDLDHYLLILMHYSYPQVLYVFSCKQGFKSSAALAFFEVDKVYYVSE